MTDRPPGTALALLLPSSWDAVEEMQCRHLNCGSMFMVNLFSPGKSES